MVVKIKYFSLLFHFTVFNNRRPWTQASDLHRQAVDSIFAFHYFKWETDDSGTVQDVKLRTAEWIVVRGVEGMKISIRSNIITSQSCSSFLLWMTNHHLLTLFLFFNVQYYSFQFLIIILSIIRSTWFVTGIPQQNISISSVGFIIQAC